MSTNKKSAVEGLSLKYRPITWSEVIGQDTTVSILQGMIVNKSYEVMNSIIVAGTSGGGKTTSARIFARAINCQCKDSKRRPCNECSHCQSFLAGEYRDFLEVDGTTYSGKDDVAELKKIARLNPIVKDGYKIILVDEAHALSSKAWDILLKDLEEGRNKTIWIFATTELHNIRPAIQGRNPVFKIKPLSQGEVLSELKRICELEEIEAPTKLLSDISRIYRGRTRDAINELDKYYKAFGKDLNKVKVNIVSPEDTLIEIMITAIKDSIISANVDLDRAEILGSDIAPAITNILTAGYLINNEELDLFDLGVDLELLKDFKECFSHKDFQKLITMTSSYDLNSLDRFKLYLMLIKELSSQKEELSVIDQIVNKDKGVTLKRASLKLNRYKEDEEQPKPKKTLKKPLKTKKKLVKKPIQRKENKEEFQMQKLGFVLDS